MPSWRLRKRSADALIALAVASLGLAAIAWFRGTPKVSPIEVAPLCVDAAHRDALGTVRCGPGAGLTTSEALLAGVPLDINSADVEALTLVSGVGARLASRIVASRPFSSVADLERVRGVGPVLTRRISTLTSP